MAYRLPSLNALRVFEAAARHLSFKKAADELAVTPTAVSHQIRGLEDELGTRLFRRLTRALALTAEGEAMLPKVREGLECFVAAVGGKRARAEADRLVVVAPPSFASRWLVPRLRGFRSADVPVELHVAGSPATIDRPLDAERGAAAIEDCDLEIRFGAGHYPGRRVAPILTPDFVAVCHPDLLTGKRPLRHPDDLRFHALIHDDSFAPGPERPSWEVWCRIAGIDGIDTEAGPHFGDLALALSAAADGLGLAIAPEPLVAADIAAGRLASPFTVRIRTPYGYFLVAREEVADRPAVRAFRDWLLAEAAAGPRRRGARAPAGWRVRGGPAPAGGGRTAS